ncbi:MAG: hypothetical protein N2438_01920 [Limisphaera sp.]|nr:hypothetical protein [Limisphaera sp.]
MLLPPSARRLTRKVSPSPDGLNFGHHPPGATARAPPDLHTRRIHGE